MKKDFIAFLQENLRYLGFGESASGTEKLEQEMEKGQKEFQLTTEAHFDEWSKMEATLYFRKSENDQKYFFIRYDASLQYPDNSEHNKLQTFYIHNGAGVTFKEAYNLLEGRAVYKHLTDSDEMKYHAWIQLNFMEIMPNNNYKIRQFREGHGYDLERVLYDYPIKELEDDDLRANLIRSLQKGNLHLVTFAKERKKEKMYIAACPQSKTIVICSTPFLMHHEGKIYR
ncbi:MAG: hypothetical protein BGO55_03365 [Sphingobacteriales bacterium 50-39]|nr:hypothetical protein [Sphingobacteriales bacterium]OJW55593.1 MAG: hypothetical protein BGO55_03365 [Sphingobacteriales bacterium 50-39]